MSVMSNTRTAFAKSYLAHACSPYHPTISLGNHHRRHNHHHHSHCKVHSICDRVMSIQFIKSSTVPIYSSTLSCSIHRTRTAHRNPKIKPPPTLLAAVDVASLAPSVINTLLPSGRSE
ncbi:extensin [Iris pallida]|uniref:Extensin n=1 Tax=Iris pallida TaxID=29817 RepID=A0AAX6I9E4_IRIPA|nr:extensin [Iris pallida]